MGESFELGNLPKRILFLHSNRSSLAQALPQGWSGLDSRVRPVGANSILEKLSRPWEVGPVSGVSQTSSSKARFGIEDGLCACSIRPFGQRSAQADQKKPFGKRDDSSGSRKSYP